MLPILCALREVLPDNARHALGSCNASACLSYLFLKPTSVLLEVAATKRERPHGSIDFSSDSLFLTTRPSHDLFKIEAQDVRAWRLTIRNAMLRNHLVDSSRFDVQ